jgi:hypothetical protein
MAVLVPGKGLRPIALLPQTENEIFDDWEPHPEVIREAAAYEGMPEAEKADLMQTYAQILGDALSNPGARGGCDDPDCPGCGTTEKAEAARAEIREKAETMAAILHKAHNAPNN